MVVGLLGGSFDPAHEGHAHITREAMKRMRLDQVWWLVSPGNPLKAHPPAPLADRMARAKRVMPDPRLRITDLDSRIAPAARRRQSHSPAYHPLSSMSDYRLPSDMVGAVPSQTSSCLAGASGYRAEKSRT